MKLRVESKQHVIWLTILITGLSIAAPVGVVGGILLSVDGMPMQAVAFGVLISFLIPLFIAPPISYLGLSMLRILTQTIDKVDSHVKFDGLTGALNRTHFLDSMRGRQASGVLLIVDADHFKRINDSRGHAAGDEALRVLANTLNHSIGTKGLVGRLGGEEFGIFLPGFSKQAGTDLAVSICDAVRSLEMIVESSSLKLTVSIGGTLHRAQTTIGHSLKIADRALYAAKETGRDRVIFDHSYRAQNERLLA